MRLESSSVRYEQNRSAKFYLCRMCRTHVASHEHMLLKYADRRHALFQEIQPGEASSRVYRPNKHIINYRSNRRVNVVIGEDLHDIQPGQEAALVDCANCSANFGEKVICEMFPSLTAPEIKPGRFLIDLKTLLMWNGVEVVNADTELPTLRAGEIKRLLREAC